MRTEIKCEVEEQDSCILNVPGFGFLGVKRDREGDVMASLFVPPDTEGRPVPAADRIKETDDEIIIAMLHKFDRIDVVIKKEEWDGRPS